MFHQKVIFNAKKGIKNSINKTRKTYIQPTKINI